MTPADLKAIRQKQRFSQEAMARLFGVTANTWYRYERGKLPIPHWLPPLLVAHPLFASKKKK